MLRILKLKTIVLLFLLYGFCDADTYEELDCQDDNFDI